jgi:ATP-dependent Lon protease
VPVAVSRPASIRLVDEAVASGSLVVVSAQRDDDPAQWYAVGALAQVHRLVRLHDGTLRIALQAFDRVVIDRVTQQEPYLRVQVHRLPDRLDNPNMMTHLRGHLRM